MLLQALIMSDRYIDANELYYNQYQYGVCSYDSLLNWQVEAQAFLAAPGPETLTKFEHLKNMLGWVWPDSVEEKSWNPWLERVLKACTNEDYTVRRHGTVIRTVILSGAAAAGKTYSAGLYACAWWLASPHNSIAYVTSTSRGMIRRRVWPIIQKFAGGGFTNRITGEYSPFGGNMVDSKTILQASKGDDKHSISALAVAQGDVAEAVAKLSGQHEERVLLIIDEGQATPEAIYRTIPNLRKACVDLTIIIIENPSGRLTPSGQASEPKGGWHSIGLETQQWRTKGVPDWQLEPGLCVRFDGKESPNVHAGTDKWPFLYTNADWEAAQEISRVDTLSYWIQDRGLQPPEGTSNTVFTEQLVERCDGYGDFTFISRKRLLSFLDPAFGGNTCWIQFGEVGDTEDGIEGIKLTEGMAIPINTESKLDIEKQIALRVMDECRKRGVKPEDFGLDATGIGRGVAYALAEEWSPLIRRVEFGGAASELPAAGDDMRPSREVYDRKVTELWWSVREFLIAGQIRGFTKTAVTQFCSRQYEMRGKRYSVEKKEDMKAKLGFSPDEADSISGIVEIAREQGFELKGKLQRTLERQTENSRKKSSDVLAYDADVGGGGWAEEDVWDDETDQETEETSYIW